MIVSGNPDDVLITYSLGSCLGVTAYDPVTRFGGMIHCMLPLSKIDLKKAADVPYMFVDTGIPILINKLLENGAEKKRIILKAAGCSHVLDNNNHFRIGERNYAILRKILWKNNMLIKNESIGGTVSRTITLHIGTGDTFVKIKGVKEEL